MCPCTRRRTYEIKLPDNLRKYTMPMLQEKGEKKVTQSALEKNSFCMVNLMISLALACEQNTPAIYFSTATTRFSLSHQNSKKKKIKADKRKRAVFLENRPSCRLQSILIYCDIIQTIWQTPFNLLSICHSDPI